MNKQLTKALEWVFKAEGCDSNDPNDRGGATRFGISLGFLMHHEQGDINNDGAINPADIKALTKQQAADFYQADFWNKCRCDELPFPIALIVFDQAVNTGIGATVRLLQYHIGVKVDGIIGTKTLAKTVAVYINDPDWFVASYLGRRAAYYQKVVQKHPSSKGFLRGWLNRLFLLQQFVLENR